MADDEKRIQSIPMGSGRIHFAEITIEAVMRIYIKSAIPAEGTRIEHYEWFYDPNKGIVVLKLFVEDIVDSTKSV